MNRARMAAVVALAVALLSCPRAHADPSDTPSVAIVETRGGGVTGAALTAVTRQLYATVGRLGYRTIPDAVTAELSGRLAPVFTTPAALLAIAVGAHATHALGATLGAEQGHYVVVVTLANQDRSGPFLARGAADAATLESLADRLTRSLLPAVPLVTPRVPSPRSITTHSRIAVQTESAFGVSSRPFYNQLFGLRYDYAFTEELALGGYLGYVNLKGKDGRASNVLPYVQLEYRLHGAGNSGFRIPLRFDSGYLPKNGPFLRFSAGLSFPLGDTAHLGFDLLAPTLWVVKNSTTVSMDVAAEVLFDF